MKIKNHEIEIPQENPFANCKLSREPYARVLTDIVNTYAEGFVLAINNEWGTGKTTFMKMWKQQLLNDGFKTIYFNAWENDFESNPLVALMSELKTIMNSENKEIFKSVVEKGAVLVKNIAPALVKSLIRKYVVDIDEIAADAIENATKATSEIFEEEIKEFSSKKKTIVEFRKDLEKFVNLSENNKPLVFIIDELDRCRPNYAVEVLEQIKHFFSVPGIVFVLSIDKKHLGGSVKGFYGSEQIDSNEYLKRFIDLEYSIPNPSAKEFMNYLFDYYSFEKFFSSQERMKYNEFRNDSENFILIAEFLLTQINTTLRQQERIFALTRLALCSFNTDQYTFPSLLFILVYIKIMKEDLFHKINNNELTLQELSNEIQNLLFSASRNGDHINLGYVEGLILWFYNNNREYPSKVKLLKKDEEGHLISPINSKLVDERRSMYDVFKSISYERYQDIKLNYLVKKINLNEPLTH